MHKDHVEAYWKDWVLKESDGDPFSFRIDKGKGREKKVVEEEEEEEEIQEDQKDQVDEDQEDQEKRPLAAEKPAIPPTPAFDIDNGIPLPCQCKTPLSRTHLLQLLVQKWGSGKAFHTLVKLVDDLEVGFIWITQISLYLISFQDTDIPSGFQNSQWQFTKWSWDTVHLSKEAHEDRGQLNDFLKWLTQTASGLSKQAIFKNQLQEILLGVGLFIRDHEFVCFSDHEETPVPAYLADSCMAASDADPINRVLEMISHAVHKDLGYVSTFTT